MPPPEKKAVMVMAVRHAKGLYISDFKYYD
jgi:hypothetical protein